MQKLDPKYGLISQIEFSLLGLFLLLRFVFLKVPLFLFSRWLLVILRLGSVLLFWAFLVVFPLLERAAFFVFILALLRRSFGGGGVGWGLRSLLLGGAALCLSLAAIFVTGLLCRFGLFGLLWPHVVFCGL